VVSPFYCNAPFRVSVRNMTIPTHDKQEGPLSKRIAGMDLSEKMRLAQTGDKEARSLLVRDPNKLILTYLLQNPRISDHEILQLAREKTLPEEILDQISKRKEWMKKYPVRLALAQNPKTPLPLSLRLLNSFRDFDLRRIARSKDVSGHVASGARKILKNRGLL
jgi:hypothetical protein